MAKGRKPDENQNSSLQGDNSIRAKTEGNDEASQIPESYPGLNDGNETEQLSEAIGGGLATKEESNLQPENVVKSETNKILWEGDVVDTKSSENIRPSPNVYRSLSSNAEEESKTLRKSHGTLRWTNDGSSNDLGFNSEFSNPVEGQPISGSSTIRLGGTALYGRRVDGVLEQANNIPSQSLAPGEQNSIETCSDIGSVSSVVSCATESHSLLKVTSKDFHYKDDYEGLRKKAKIYHKMRMNLRNESDPGCFEYCIHPTQKHDWQNHGAKKKLIYNYAAVRTGHLFQRERNTDHYKEVGTCSHVGDGFVFTCYHCISDVLYRDGCPNELLLEQDLAVLFPKDINICPGQGLNQYSFKPFLHSFSESLDYAVLRLDLGKAEQIPPHYARYSNDNESQEHPVYIAGYQLHSKHKHGKLVVDATALKLPLDTLSLDFVEGWSKKLKDCFQVKNEKLQGILQFRIPTYYPITRCGKNFPVLSSLISGASGGFGLSYTPQDEVPVVNFMYRSGYPAFFYNSHFCNTTASFHEENLAIQKGFYPCWSFQAGIPMKIIVEEILKSRASSLSSVPFLLSNM
ncbi:uncharacterized protein LOC132551166 [Ylistrum balloti]|uniref:uncharacterized protein LOC132551166 n=1 Tax=Ylistrum balloti TaxID=509963 RepID=UPI002905A70E|nr:uncharacterized protein LOC132551166 [Ylistrum balloti]